MIDAVRRPRYPGCPALPSQRTKEVSRAPLSRDRRSVRGRHGALQQRDGVVLAGRRPRAAALRTRRRCLRCRTTPRRRRRRSRGIARPRCCIGHRDVRGLAADPRPGRHDPDERRLRSHARPPRLRLGGEGSQGHGGRHDRAHGLERHAGARRADGPPRDQASRRGRGLRRPARPAARAPRGTPAGSGGTGVRARTGPGARAVGRLADADSADGACHAVGSGADRSSCDAAGAGGRPACHADTVGGVLVQRRGRARTNARRPVVHHERSLADAWSCSGRGRAAHSGERRRIRGHEPWPCPLARPRDAGDDRRKTCFDRCGG